MTKYKTTEFAEAKVYSVYVIEIQGGDDKELYVGQTWHSPDFRHQQHLDGVRRGRVFKRRGRAVGPLRPDLLPPLEPLISRPLATAAEAYVAEVLRAQGFIVHGGH